MSNRAVRVARARKKEVLFRERRHRPRKAPGYPSRKGAKLVEGLTKSELVERYASKVRIIAATLSGKLPRSVDLDDMISVGFIGLMDAADKFEASRGIKFATYAEFRIRGAILDELRNQDQLPRSARDLAKKVEHAASKIHRQTGRAPSEQELSAALGMTPLDLREAKIRIMPVQLVNYDDMDAAGALADADVMAGNIEGVSPPDPSVEAMRNDTRGFVDELFQLLGDDERLVLSFYYYRGLNLREIADILEVSESRVSQIHSTAILRLKTHLCSIMADPKALFRILLEA